MLFFLSVLITLVKIPVFSASLSTSVVPKTPDPEDRTYAYMREYITPSWIDLVFS